MKGILRIGLTIVMTAVAVFAMITFSSNADSKTQNVYQSADKATVNGTNETGYMFDDYGRHVNIPLEKNMYKSQVPRK